MSCLSCQFCHCNLSTQTKTQLIIYPSNSNSFKSPSLQDYTFKIRRNKKEGISYMPSDEEQESPIKIKIAQTMDTVSKLISVPSTYRLNDFISGVSFSTMRNDRIQWARSQFVSSAENKENTCINLSKSILDLESKPKQQSAHKLKSRLQLPSKSSGAESICKSNTFDGKNLKASQQNIHTPCSSQVSEKNLSVILYEKENQQLREELRRLKQKQNELLAEQCKIREKNNREIGHLKKRSQQLEARSSMRKKQLNELKNMLKLVEKVKDKIEPRAEKVEN